MSITATSQASVNSSSQGLPIQLRILSNILNSVISWTILFDMMKTSNSPNFEIWFSPSLPRLQANAWCSRTPIEARTNIRSRPLLVPIKSWALASCSDIDSAMFATNTWMRSWINSKRRMNSLHSVEERLYSNQASVTRTKKILTCPSLTHLMIRWPCMNVGMPSISNASRGTSAKELVYVEHQAKKRRSLRWLWICLTNSSAHGATLRNSKSISMLLWRSRLGEASEQQPAASRGPKILWQRAPILAAPATWTNTGKATARRSGNKWSTAVETNVAPPYPDKHAASKSKSWQYSAPPSPTKESTCSTLIHSIEYNQSRYDICKMKFNFWMQINK